MNVGTVEIEGSGGVTRQAPLAGFHARFQLTPCKRQVPGGMRDEFDASQSPKAKNGGKSTFLEQLMGNTAPVMRLQMGGGEMPLLIF